MNAIPMEHAARGRYLADFAELERRLPGADLPWLASVRREALERFAELGFPTTRDEDWKYTSVAALEKRHFTMALKSPLAPPFSKGGMEPHALAPLAPPFEKGGMGGISSAVSELALDGAHLLVFVDGHFAPGLSRVNGLPAGVVVGGLAEILGKRPEMAEALISSEPCPNGFAALNSAFMTDGAVVYLPAGAALDQPVHALFLATRDDAVSHVRNLILAENGAEATVIEHYAALNGATNFTNAVTRIRQGANSGLEHIKLQQESIHAYHVAGIHASQDRDSRFTSHSVALGARLARNDLSARLDAENCECHLNGLYMVGGRQHVDHHTSIDHAKPHGMSREYYRGVLDGAARAVFNGKVIVRANAQHTDAHQANNNLLLSREAEVDTKPQLEIFADDVKCAHGATVGQLDENMLFYLRSRGMDEARARSLLTYAFAGDVIHRIRVAPLKSRLEALLINRLPQGDRIRELL